MVVSSSSDWPAGGQWQPLGVGSVAGDIDSSSSNWSAREQRQRWDGGGVASLVVVSVAGGESPEQSLVGQRGDDCGLTAVSTALHLEQLDEREVVVAGSEWRLDCLMERETVVGVDADVVVGSKQMRAPRV